jgi:hypothetical protein
VAEEEVASFIMAHRELSRDNIQEAEDRNFGWPRRKEIDRRYYAAEI